MKSVIDITILEEYLAKGLLKRQRRPELDLYIWNYAEKVQFNREWDQITKVCRGLVTDFNGNIVARSFSKFFNLAEIDQDYVNLKSDPLKDQFKVYEKLDGSMGMLFYYLDNWVFCSRGSFTSEQAIKGYSIFRDKFDKYTSLLDTSLSYIFEIIYPENRIVLEYDYTDIVLLTAFEKNGTERNDVRNTFIDAKLSVAKQYNSLNPYLLKDENVENREGYVLVFENGERLKIKFENYLKLHKQLGNLTVQNAFDWIKSGESLEKIVELIPDEYHPWYKNITAKINLEYDRVRDICIKDYFTYFSIDRKQFALNIKKHKFKSVLFKMYDIIYSSMYSKDEWISKLNDEPYCTIIFKLIETSEFFQELKKEDLSTQLRDTYINSRHHNILNTFKNSDDLILTEHISKSKKPPCYIFDIDGTLALNLNGRSPYDMSRVLEDKVHYAISHTLKLLSHEVSIVICTGRSEDSEEKTKLWLKINNIKYNDIYFRPYKNREPDYLIKERMWRHINKDFNIIALYDDRDQVVKHGRKLGMTVFQVAEGNF
jgi:RNA ligase